MSKFRKWHLREPKINLQNFPGACHRTPLEACAFGANNYSLFSISWVWVSVSETTKWKTKAIKYSIELIYVKNLLSAELWANET